MMGELNIQVKRLKGKSPILLTWWNNEINIAEGCLITCPCQKLGMSDKSASASFRGKGKKTCINDMAINLAKALEQAEIVSIPVRTEHHSSPEFERDTLKEQSHSSDVRMSLENRTEEKDRKESGKSDERRGNAPLVCSGVGKLDAEKGRVPNDSRQKVLKQKQIGGCVTPTTSHCGSGVGSLYQTDTLDINPPESGSGEIDKRLDATLREVKNLASQLYIDVSVNNDNSDIEMAVHKPEGVNICKNFDAGSSKTIPKEVIVNAAVNNKTTQSVEEKVEATLIPGNLDTKFIDVGGFSSNAVVVVSDSKEISDVEGLFRALKGIIEQDIPQEVCNDVPETMASMVLESIENTPAMLKYEEHKNELYLKKLHQKPKTRCAETAVCEVCGAVINTRTIKKHMAAFHLTEQRDRKFACEICGKKFFRMENRDRHIRLHSEPSFHCQQCGRSFMQAYQLKAHAKTHSGHKPPPRIRRPTRKSLQDPSNEKNTVCKKCGVELKRKDLKAHKEAVHGVEEPSFECSHCGKTFYSKSSFKIHSLTHTGLTYKCSFCEESFKQNKDRLRHERTHADTSFDHGMLRFKCGYCEKSYSKQADRLRHEMTHVDATIDASHGRGISVVLVDCQVCGKTLKQQSLRNHMASHNHKRWTCNICEKTFTYSYRYQHAKLHQGNKCHVCSHCSARFLSKSALVVHMRKHTKERPIPCRYCDRTFSRHGTRNAHERLHTGERPYRCEPCQKGWRDRPTYMQHMHKHHPGLPLMKWRKTNPQPSQNLVELSSS